MKLRSTPSHVTVRYNREAESYTVVKATGREIPKVDEVLTGADLQQLIDRGVRVSLS